MVFAEPFGSLHGSYAARMLCDRVHLEGARALAPYGQ